MAPKDSISLEFDEFKALQQYTPPLTNKLAKNYTRVDWGITNVKSKDANHDLATFGLSPCTALAIINPQTHCQTLAHAFPYDMGTQSRGTISDMHTVIKNMVVNPQIGGGEAKYYIVEGTAKHHQSTYNIYAALREAGVKQSQLFFIPSRDLRNGVYNTENIVIRDGEVLRAANDLVLKTQTEYNVNLIENKIGKQGIALLSKSLASHWPSVQSELSKEYQRIQKLTFTNEEERNNALTNAILQSSVFSKLEKLIKQDADVLSSLGKSQHSTIATYVECARNMVIANPKKYFEVVKPQVAVSNSLRNEEITAVQRDAVIFDSQKSAEERLQGLKNLYDRDNNGTLDEAEKKAGWFARKSDKRFNDAVEAAIKEATKNLKGNSINHTSPSASNSHLPLLVNSESNSIT